MLWCNANAERLAEQGVWVVCADEMPNKQVLERCPIRRAIPGSIEQQEFEYTRHGTVNILTFLVVHTGRWRRPAWRRTTPSIITPASKIGVVSGASRWPLGLVSCAIFLAGVMLPGQRSQQIGLP